MAIKKSRYFETITRSFVSLFVVVISLLIGCGGGGDDGGGGGSAQPSDSFGTILSSGTLTGIVSGLDQEEPLSEYWTKERMSRAMKNSRDLKKPVDLKAGLSALGKMTRQVPEGIGKRFAPYNPDAGGETKSASYGSVSSGASPSWKSGADFSCPPSSYKTLFHKGTRILSGKNDGRSFFRSK